MLLCWKVLTLRNSATKSIKILSSDILYIIRELHLKADLQTWFTFSLENQHLLRIFVVDPNVYVMVFGKVVLCQRLTLSRSSMVSLKLKTLTTVVLITLHSPLLMTLQRGTTKLH